ncbi:6-pyruvoyl-tetrahydropterin synthase-related protein [Ilumatobacter sp.]|uniref:6-pyruvoyl-tetrahydropterin synthase-related protein n=1 Tax=Ilumatobacter sp. TaxID=1967498 RepID=UPI003B51C704
MSDERFGRAPTTDGTGDASSPDDEAAADDGRGRAATIVVDAPGGGSATVGRESVGDDPPGDVDDPATSPDAPDAGGAPADPPPPRPRRALARAGRRPTAWWNREWTTERIIRLVVTAVSLAVTTVIVMLVVHLEPIPFIGGRDLILDRTTPTGGDMGAHVWAPAFLRDHLLPNLQLSGWSMDWYGGLPLYRFYMVIPALAIVALDVLLPYGIAFKLVAISGIVTFPVACWAFGRLAAFRHPIPELFAFGGVCFLLDESFEIYGGNVKSTMAGEYSFSIALTLAVLGLGLLAHGLRTGRFRVRAAIVLSLAAVCHGIVLIFVAVAATLLCLVWVDSTRLRYALTTGAATVLLSAWWVGPFLFGHEFMTDMKYGYRPNSSDDSFWDMYFPLTPALDIAITTLAVIAVVAFVLRRQLTGTALGLICVVFAILVWNTRESLPVIGLLWNPRLLPFVYLTRYLLMVVGAYEVIAWGINAARDRRAAERLRASEAATAFAIVGLSIVTVFGWMYEVLPNGGRVVETEGESAVYAWGPFRKGPESGRAVADGWSRYNFTGYEGRTAYPAYHHLVETMAEIGRDPERGCGKAVWENNSDNSEYGTTMALMLLPHWTRGCIGSSEGLFFEATASTNYHFLTAAAVSESSSNPVRQLRYENLDTEVGVRHLDDIGARYLMVRTDAAKSAAAEVDGLEFVVSSGTWDVYQVSGSEQVEALEVEPVVVDHDPGAAWYKPGDDRERNLELGTSWFQDRAAWPAMPVDDGPEGWQRATATIAEDDRIEPFDDQARKVDRVRPLAPIEPTPLPPVAVSAIDTGEQSLSFRVDRVGVPVVVKVSYFPNWEVAGAQGPFRAGANQMVVVPTSEEVTLTYDPRGTLDWFFYGVTLAGIALCVALWRLGDVGHAGPVPSLGSLGRRRRRRGDGEDDASGAGSDDALDDRSTDGRSDHDTSLDDTDPHGTERGDADLDDVLLDRTRAGGVAPDDDPWAPGDTRRTGADGGPTP